MSVVNKTWWVENLLRHTDDLPENATTTIRIDCPSGYNWHGALWDLRDALKKAVEMASLKEALNRQGAIRPGETLTFEPPRWEYRFLESIYSTTERLETLLNEMGREGWELVNIEFKHGRAIFKRPK